MLKKKNHISIAIFFMLFIFTAINASAYTVTGTYTVTFNTGYGNPEETGSYQISDSPLDPLVFTSSYTTQGGSVATAAAGFWGYGTDDSWGAWLTDGTGVTQSHPKEDFSDPATMTIDFDFTLTGDGAVMHTSWYDMVYLNGTVGNGGYAEFYSTNDMYIGTISTGEEVWNSSAPLNYLKDTAGFFYAEVKNDACNYGDSCFQYLTDDNYLRFLGSYTFIAKNDGGPTGISFAQDPAPVPEPASLLLLGVGLLSLIPLRKRMK